MHSPPSITSAAGGDTAISALHPDIIQTHILTKTDGPTLASAACASPLLHALCTEEKLWTNICNSTWPSTNQSFVPDVISTFPAGHRSFFADAFSAIDHRRPAGPAEPSSPVDLLSTSQLISTVDIHYENNPIYTKVEITDTETEWFRCSPFRIDLIDPKEPVTTYVKFDNQSDLQKHMRLSWVVIDPTRKRAVNISTRSPVSVQRHWLTGDVQVQYATIMSGDRVAGRSPEYIQCSVVVTCGRKEGGELQVREVSLHVQDMEGKCLSGRDSLVILQGAMESKRRKNGNGTEERERYEEFVEMKRESSERKQRREKRLDLLCMATGVTIFVAFWAFILL